MILIEHCERVVRQCGTASRNERSCSCQCDQVSLHSILHSCTRAFLVAVIGREVLSNIMTDFLEGR